MIRHLLQAARDMRRDDLVEWLVKAETARRKEAGCNCKTCRSEDTKNIFMFREKEGV